jgi:hypothetical protein
MSQDSTGEITNEFNHEEHRTKWLKRLADELDKIEPLMPFKFLPDGIEYPKWVLNVEREFSLVVPPSAKLKDPDFKLTRVRRPICGCRFLTITAKCFAQGFWTLSIRHCQKSKPNHP